MLRLSRDLRAEVQRECGFGSRMLEETGDIVPALVEQCGRTSTNEHDPFILGDKGCAFCIFGIGQARLLADGVKFLKASHRLWTQTGPGRLPQCGVVQKMQWSDRICKVGWECFGLDGFGHHRPDFFGERVLALPSARA